MDGYESEDTRKLFVGGLNPRTTEEGLKSFFQSWGEIRHVDLAKDRTTGHPRGFAFITYARSYMVDRAAGFHGIDGNRVKARRHIPRNNIRQPPGGWIKLEDAAVEWKLDMIPAFFLNKLKLIDYTHDGQLKYGNLKDLPQFCKEATGALAMDCEMVGVGSMNESALAKVSIVNEWGFCVLDTFVKPQQKVTNYRTEVSGIRPEDLIGGMPFIEARSKVAELLRGKILVGHSLEHDLKALSISHPPDQVRDTAVYFQVPGENTPSLRQLADKILRMEIQRGEHSSIQDAQVTMKVYLIYRQGWEKSL